MGHFIYSLIVFSYSIIKLFYKVCSMSLETELLI